MTCVASTTALGTDKKSTAPTSTKAKSPPSDVNGKSSEQKSLVPSDKLRCALSEAESVQLTVAKYLTLHERLTFFRRLAKSVKPTKTVKDKLDNWKAMLDQLRIITNYDFLINTPLCTLEGSLKASLLSLPSPIVEIVDGSSHLLIRTLNDKIFLLSPYVLERFRIGRTINPQEIPFLSDRKIVQLATGLEHTLLLTADGTVLGLGRNPFGQLGLGYTADKLCFDPIPRIKAKKIFAGQQHSFIITTDDDVLVCGLGDNGRLGLGYDKSCHYVPTKIDILSGIGIQKIVTGSSFNLALDIKGNVFVFGCNFNGSLGLGDDEDRRTPEILPGIQAKDIAAGVFHSLILTRDGKVMVCGDTSYGQLGLNLPDTKNVRTLTPLNIPGQVQHIFAGDFCSLFVTAHQGKIQLYGCGKLPRIGLDSCSVVFIKDLPTELFERPAPASQQDSACDSAEDKSNVEEVILQAPMP